MARRSADTLTRRFARLPTAAITDIMDEMGLLRQTLPSDLQPLDRGMRMAGYAFTARGRSHRGSKGDHDQTLRRFLGMISARKVRGAVIDGATRDAASIVRLGFPTFVRYRTPQDSVPRWRVSDWGQPVTIGGVRIALGDIVVADDDGIVSVPRRLAHDIVQRCEKLVAAESAVRRAIRRGTTPLAAYEKFGKF
jgi:4-hydroxy-4-methyl-2-oxoglutarate aldolase